LAEFWKDYILKYNTMSKLVTGLVIGAAAGLVAGILFAPDKGTETRKKIADKAGDFTDELKDGFNDFVDDISAKFGKAKSKALSMESELGSELPID
jgi:gas vesicle protein